jgi:molybdopterin-guanine dinucleotide biosynthesis protein B
MKIINFIGYSGSGKTTLILTLIEYLKEVYNMDTAVIKNIHEHRIDKDGSDTYLYSESGANYSIAKNIYEETTIFVKKILSIEELIRWIQLGPYKADIIFTEGFRDLEVPTILCIKGVQEIEEQLNENVKIISSLGQISQKESDMVKMNFSVPIIYINKDFEKLLKTLDFKK